MTLLDGLSTGPEFLSLHDLRRVDLADGAWIDVLPGWTRNSTELFDELVEEVPWLAYERTMYGRTVPVPRLIKNYDDKATFPHQLLVEAMALLNDHYASRQQPPCAPFTRAGLNLYRNGDDSVAWHSDTAATANEPDTLVGIFSLGSPRSLSVRPRGGRSVGRFDLGHGDLLVMGGSFQRTHEHAISKTSKHVGTRISIQYRPTWDTTKDTTRFVKR